MYIPFHSSKSIVDEGRIRFDLKSGAVVNLLMEYVQMQKVFFSNFKHKEYKILIEIHILINTKSHFS